MMVMSHLKIPGEIIACLISESVVNLSDKSWFCRSERRLQNVETLSVTSVQNENGVLQVLRRQWDLKVFVFFVLHEKFYQKKSYSWIKNACCLSSLIDLNKRKRSDLGPVFKVELIASYQHPSA